jgi:hypothetical protein
MPLTFVWGVSTLSLPWCLLSSMGAWRSCHLTRFPSAFTTETHSMVSETLSTPLVSFSLDVAAPESTHASHHGDHLSSELMGAPLSPLFFHPRQCQASTVIVRPAQVTSVVSKWSRWMSDLCVPCHRSAHAWGHHALEHRGHSPCGWPSREPCGHGPRWI